MGASVTPARELLLRVAVAVGGLAFPVYLVWYLLYLLLH
jgi:hypothetical protein